MSLGWLEKYGMLMTPVAKSELQLLVSEAVLVATVIYQASTGRFCSFLLL